MVGCQFAINAKETLTFVIDSAHLTALALCKWGTTLFTDVETTQHELEF
jgi:hypothetical protein